MKNVLTLTLLLLGFPLLAQLTQPPFTPATERVQSFDQRKALKENSLVAHVPFRSVGPTVFSGRVSDVDVWEKDPTHFYVAYASGGLWKTENNGQSFTPLFDKEMVITMGDIAVDWDRNIIWVGTGEVNSSRSSYSGVGIYKSDDGGKTWQYKGLPESHHIGRIVLHPDDPNTAWVAVLGHLYSPNAERGVYKTTDGGETWKKTLFVDNNSGAVDLVMDPANPDILYAATWHRERRAWNFVESGEGSGIWKSTDGGETWALLTDGKSGFPHGDGVGRIGLAVAQKDGETMVYAVLDNYFRRPKEKEEATEGLTKDDLRHMNKADFLQLEKSKIETFLRDNNFPKEYVAETIISMVKNDEIKPVALVEYLEDANSLLFDTPVVGAEVYCSKNGGKSWEKTHKDYLNSVFFSYGYYFGQIRVSPHDPQKLYIMGVPVLISKDGGKTWDSINGENVHVDHHALWVDPNRDGHLILGNDGGIHITYDDGQNWIKCNSPAVGQFYYIAVDNAKPYNIYGGLQDNGVWVGPSTYEYSPRWHATGHYPYESIMGGDGMQVAVDLRDNNTVYTGFQFGNYFRIDQQTEDTKRLTPKHKLGDRPYRWNWQSPIHLSVHNQDIFYMGANKLLRSFNRGDDFHEISPDLTKGGRKGDVAFGTLTAIHESPLKFGLIYTGSDDGMVYVTKDGGNTWTDITGGLVPDMWVSRIQASAFEEGRVYVALNGYRWDDFRPFVYVSEDYGATWQRIGRDLPLEPVNVIKEDPVNPDLLYVGTDNGLYISLDRGQSFMKMDDQLPDVAVHDVVVHPRDKELVVGTHGRSIYVANVAHVQQLKPELIAEPLHAFEVEKVRYNARWGRQFNPFRDPFEPDIDLPLFAQTPGKVKVTVKSENLTVKTWESDVYKGLNYLKYHADLGEKAVKPYEKQLNENRKKTDDEKDIEIKKADNDKYYLRPGNYTLVFEKDGARVETPLVISEGRR
ncbi:MAG: glycosyl hydrolase [Bacteroidetes bacterium]|nr:MAG: glycosyl hydrolase [Bacteroidota bacterium]